MNGLELSALHKVAGFVKSDPPGNVDTIQNF